MRSGCEAAAGPDRVRAGERKRHRDASDRVACSLNRRLRRPVRRCQLIRDADSAVQPEIDLPFESIHTFGDDADLLAELEPAFRPPADQRGACVVQLVKIVTQR